MSFTDLYKRGVLWDDLDNDTRKKIFLSDKEYKEGVRRCRFCGKSEEETLFDDSSHAISEMIGNKWLFSHYECRECNKAFGNNCEDSFGKYVLPFKIVSRQFGKKDKMGYSEMTGNIKMSKKVPLFNFDGQNIKALVKQTKQGQMMTLTENGFELKMERKKYIPEWVYFSLLKIGISVMPFEFLHKYVYMIASLYVAVNDCNERKKIFEKINQYGFLEYIPGKNCFEKVNVELFARKDEVPQEYPYCFLCVNFGHYSLQIPMPEDSQHNGEMIKATSYMHFDSSNISIIDFHKYEQEFKCTFLADKKEYADDEILGLRQVLAEYEKG